MELPSALESRAAAPLLAALNEVHGRPLTLDASGVERVGALCLQVLLAAQREWHANDIPFVIDRPSEAFTDAIRLMDAGSLIGEREAS
jgi:chemotaxis protein CheX